jgi:hypothetical protein
MEQPARRPSDVDCARLETTQPLQPRVLDETRAAARIPDSVAALSYGTRVLARLGGGPRIF